MNELIYQNNEQPLINHFAANYISGHFELFLALEQPHMSTIIVLEALLTKHLRNILTIIAPNK